MEDAVRCNVTVTYGKVVDRWLVQWPGQPKVEVVRRDWFLPEPSK